MVTDNNLSSSLQTTLAVGGALVLVAGVVIHQNKDRLSSLFVENLAGEGMNQNTDWEKLTIPAQVCICCSIERVFIRLHAEAFKIFCGRGISLAQFFLRESCHSIFTLHIANMQSSLKYLKCFGPHFMGTKNEWDFIIFFILFLNKHMYIDRHSIRVVLGSRMS